MPSPADWVWTNPNEWKPLWTTLPQNTFHPYKARKVPLSMAPAFGPQTHSVSPTLDPTSDTMTDYQGGKHFGELREKQDDILCTINEEVMNSGKYKDVEQLDRKLEAYKKKYMEFDTSTRGGIDLMSLKRMMEKLGMAKTHLELKKMMAEVSTTDPEVITYRDFLDMMLGKHSTVLKLILMFEELKAEPSRPSGPAPKRDLSSLP
uniref:allograft inflammatory factor 1-like n=1 Tax=Myxine glutinosa TaxID=7769 RepID=UPI00358EF16A